MKFTEANDWTCRVHAFIPQPAEKYLEKGEKCFLARTEKSKEEG